MMRPSRPQKENLSDLLLDYMSYTIFNEFSKPNDCVRLEIGVSSYKIFLTSLRILQIL